MNKYTIRFLTLCAAFVPLISSSLGGFRSLDVARSSTPELGVCLCSPSLPPLEAAAEADAVFFAKVTSVTDRSQPTLALRFSIYLAKTTGATNYTWVTRGLQNWYEEVADPWVEVEFEVLEAYKGVDEKTHQLQTSPQTGACGLGFATGRTHLIYAWRIEYEQTSRQQAEQESEVGGSDTGHLWTDRCTRTTTASRYSEETVILRKHYIGDER